MYVITGATGNSGHRIAEALLDAGLPVRAVGRNADKLKPLADRGAEAFVADLADAEAMARAFDGAKAAYIMAPPNFGVDDYRGFQNDITKTLADAIGKSAVTHVVSLSSVGAHLAEGVGPIGGLRDMEQHLNALDNVYVLHLRPCFFMENWLFSIAVIKNNGFAGSALRGDLTTPMIAVRDVAAEAAERLKALDFSNHSTRELLGQRDLGVEEAAQILGRSIGSDKLPYVQFDYDDYAKGLRDAGFSAATAELMIEMYRSFNDGTLRPAEPRTDTNTTPTSIEDFAPVFAGVYNQ